MLNIYIYMYIYVVLPGETFPFKNILSLSFSLWDYCCCCYYYCYYYHWVVRISFLNKCYGIASVA